MPRGINGPLPRPTDADIERLRARLTRVGECLIWTGATRNGAYGVISVGKQLVLTHRLAFYIATGIDPLQLDVLHSCDTPPCCEPSHLSLGDQATNAADMVARRRNRTGEAHYFAKLTATDVNEIRARYAAGGISQPRLAREYGVSCGSIANIIHNRTWRVT